jgi:hypothetical protein
VGLRLLDHGGASHKRQDVGGQQPVGPPPTMRVSTNSERRFMVLPLVLPTTNQLLVGLFDEVSNITIGNNPGFDRSLEGRAGLASTAPRSPCVR